MSARQLVLTGPLQERMTGARFSTCERYRYTLWRSWGPEPPIAFLMLNPSTADEVKNDPTVERCERRAVRMGAGGLTVVNIFALRSTDPKQLYRVGDPVGPENDGAIVAACKPSPSTCGRTWPLAVICAWGKHGQYQERGAKVLRLLRDNGVSPLCLGLNGDGTPKHPLYVPYAVEPFEVPR